MNYLNYSRFFNVLLSFSLLITSLPIPLFAQELMTQTVECDNNFSDLFFIADFITRVSCLDNDKNSPLHQLKAHIENGFSLTEQDVVAQALYYAEIILQKNYAQLDESQAIQLYADFEKIAQKFLNGSFTRSYINIATVNGLLSVNDQLVQNITAVNLSAVDEIVSNSLTIIPFNTAGIIHNNSSGLLSSSLIVDADVSASAGIVDTKLATISTAGKVANSATTATSANTASTIVARDGSGNFSAGTITANLSGNATTATTATNFSGSLAGEVTGTQGATVVSNAVSANTASAIVRRDGSGGFSAGAISVTDEVVSTSLTIMSFGTAGIVHNSAAGLLSSSLIVNADVAAGAAIVDTKLATISTAGKVSNSATTATSANTASAIVARDASGNFSAGTITANLSGNATTATTATNFSGSLAGEVTGTQGATVVSNAVSANTASAIVRRTATGGFSAGTISVTDVVASGNLNLTTEPSSSTAGNILKNGNRFIHDFGTNNTFVGLNAGNFTMSGSGANSAFGSFALTANTTGVNNTAIGNVSLLNNTIGTENTAVGSFALSANTTGSQNTAVGSFALPSNTTGSANTAVGYNALFGNSIGFSNTAVGISTLQTNTTGSQNTAVGQNSLLSNTIGSQNTAVGNSALLSNTTGSANIAVGFNALPSVTTGINNIAIGYISGGVLTTGSGNVYINANAGSASEANTTRIGTSQTACYIQGIFGVTTPTGTPALVAADSTGKLGTASFTTTSANTANAIVQRDGSGGFSAGTVTLAGNLNLTTEPSSSTAGNILKNGNRFIHDFGTNNTFVGLNAGNFTMSGSGANSAFGVNALTANTTGDSNIAVGNNALAANTTGVGNIAVGSQALVSNTVGDRNVAVGLNALTANTTGFYNIAIGANAIESNITGSYNVALGYHTLQVNSTGFRNIAIGAEALSLLSTGTDNIGIGYRAGFSQTTGNGCIYIDNLGATESNTTRIGAAQTKTFIAGINGIAVTGVAVLVAATGQLGTLVSSQRFKHNIKDMNSESSNIYQLRPVTFAYNSDALETKQYGLIAEEVDEVFPDIVVYDADDQPETVQYHVLPVLLLNEMKKQQATIQQQQSTIDNLIITVEQMNAAINTLQEQIKRFIERTNILENWV